MSVSGLSKLVANAGTVTMVINAWLEHWTGEQSKEGVCLFSALLTAN